ncbi:MAG: hypothetical protein KKB20_13970, partial [Proteobacteria bacterium]|nr:hypothetical protein [Pseudomonadota bacterium]
MMEQTRFFNEAVETLAPDRLLDLQWERLQERLDYLGRHSPFYQRKFAQTDLKPSEIKDLDDFRQRVPFTVKDEIKAVREADRDGFGGLLCVPRDRIVHLVRTGGTTGLPTMYAVTENDLRTMGELTARLWYQIGARPGHTVPIGTFGSWNAFALAVLEGLRTAGLTRYHFSMPAPGEEVFPLEVLPQWLEVHGLYLSPRPLLNVTVKYGLRLKEMLPHLEYMLM